MPAVPPPARLRSLYRSFLRELPSRRLYASPLQKRIRAAFETDGRTGVDKAEQYLQYLKAQRMYATLVERYNPGLNLEEEERVKLTARRVGMELPLGYETQKN